MQSDYLTKLKAFYGLNSVQLMTFEFPFRKADLDTSEDPNAHLAMDAGGKMLTVLNADTENRVS